MRLRLLKAQLLIMNVLNQWGLKVQLPQVRALLLKEVWGPLNREDGFLAALSAPLLTTWGPSAFLPTPGQALPFRLGWGWGPGSQQLSRHLPDPVVSRLTSRQKLCFEESANCSEQYIQFTSECSYAKTL